jgi:hypothetical protein
MDDKLLTVTPPDEPSRPTTTKRGRGSVSRTPRDAPAAECIAGSTSTAPRRPTRASPGSTSRAMPKPAVEPSAPQPVPEPETPKTPRRTASGTLMELSARANSDDPDALVSLRRVLDNHADIWEIVGNLTKRVEVAFTDVITNGDRLQIESMQRYIQRLRSEHLGSDPSPVERLLVDRIVCTWLAAHHADLMAAQPGDGPLATARLRRAETTNRTHLLALQALVQMRRMLGGKRKPPPKVVQPAQPAGVEGSETAVTGTVDDRLQHIWDSPTTVIQDLAE